MENKFKAGDAVTLVGNHHPIMAIEQIEENGDCVCVWHDLKKPHKPYRFTYKPMALQIHVKGYGVSYKRP